MPRRKVDAAAVVFALLVVATVAAFAYAQRVKRDPLLVDRFGIAPTTFTPNGALPPDAIKLKFRTTTSNDATVEVIRPGGEIVAVARPKTASSSATATTPSTGTGPTTPAWSSRPAATGCG